MGIKVTAVDLEPVQWYYMHPGRQFVHGDILKLSLPIRHFDLAINCSMVEHVGLAGRYSDEESCPDGDIEAMAEMKKLLESEGRMLLTIPIGQDAVFPPLHRVYGKMRLPELLNGYIIEKEEYWTKNDRNQWILAEQSKELDLEPNRNFYGLGCFVWQAKDKKVGRNPLRNYRLGWYNP